MTEEEPDDEIPDEDVEAIREAIDAMDIEVGPSPRRPPQVQADQLSEEDRQRLEEAVEGLAFVQHAYTTDAHRVCWIGRRDEGRIVEDLVVLGPGGLAHLDQIQDRVDQLRRGRDPSEVAGLLAGP